MPESYEIINGVRRVKAAQLAGHKQIRAALFADTGERTGELDVSIEQLRSPHKSSIRRKSRADEYRWERVVEGAAQDSLPFPPIEVREGSRGVTVDEITFDFGDES